MTARELWQQRLPIELAYWDAWLGSRGVQWSDDPVAARAEFDARFDPKMPLQDELRVLVMEADQVNQSDTIRILDVGAGPATAVGKVVPGWHVSINAIDPLATQYGELLVKHGLRAPVHTWLADGEEIAALWRPNTFHLAYARNSLDHAYNPGAIVRAMYDVVMPGGAVYLLHHDREGERRGGEGLHRWNFYRRADGYAMEPIGGECSAIRPEGLTMRAIGDQTEVIIRKAHD